LWDVRNVLVSQIFLIGDLVHAMPALEDLKTLLPRARLTTLVSRSTLELAKAVPTIDEVVVFEAPQDRGVAGLGSILRAYLRLRGRAFDLAVHFDRDAKPMILSALLTVPERLGFTIARPTGTRPWARFEDLLTQRLVDPDIQRAHRVEGNRSLLGGAIGLAGGPPRRPQLSLGSEARLAARAFLGAAGDGGSGPLVLLHPGASLEQKRWPHERFVALAERLEQRLGCRVVFAFGPGDLALVEPTIHRSRGRWPVLVGRPLLEYAAVVSEVDLFVGNDSGPSHIASLMGTPTVALFGETDPAICGPYWGRVACLRAADSGSSPAAHGLDRMTIEQVLNACESILARPQQRASGASGAERPSLTA
jgi:ADP-heptose:LPS heptosyltransferase